MGIAGQGLLACFIVHDPDLAGWCAVHAVDEAADGDAIGQDRVDVHLGFLAIKALWIFHLEIAFEQLPGSDEEVVGVFFWHELKQLIVLGGHLCPGGLNHLHRSGIGPLFARQFVHLFQDGMHEGSFDLRDGLGLGQLVNGAEAIEQRALLIVGGARGRQGEWAGCR